MGLIITLDECRMSRVCTVVIQFLYLFDVNSNSFYELIVFGPTNAQQ